LTETHLVFSEIATTSQLDDTEALYEHCCFVACTNGLRPDGVVAVVQTPIPPMEPGEAILWGSRVLSADAADEYRADGYVLCELQLPVSPMGASRPPLGHPV
jgi:hypothetical protein